MAATRLVLPPATRHNRAHLTMMVLGPGAARSSGILWALPAVACQRSTRSRGRLDETAALKHRGRLRAAATSLRAPKVSTAGINADATSYHGMRLDGMDAHSCSETTCKNRLPCPNHRRSPFRVPTLPCQAGRRPAFLDMVFQLLVPDIDLRTQAADDRQAAHLYSASCCTCLTSSLVPTPTSTPKPTPAPTPTPTLWPSRRGTPSATSISVRARPLSSRALALAALT